MVNNTPYLVDPGCELTRNKTKGQTDGGQHAIFIIVKADIKEYGIFLWASGLQRQTFLPSSPRPGQDAPHRGRAQHGISKEEEEWCPTSSPFLIHSLLSDEFLLPGVSMRQWRGDGSFTVMVLLYMANNKCRGKRLPPTVATSRGFL